MITVISTDSIVSLLLALNRALSSAIVILAFSLLVYILTHNLRSSVARSFSALIACVCITYVGDVALYETTSRPFDVPPSGKIAVKVINDYGDEVMKVFEVAR